LILGSKQTFFGGGGIEEKLTPETQEPFN